MTNGRINDGGPASACKIREPGSDTDPQLVELRFYAGQVVQLHCRDEPENKCILSGSMVIGNRTVRPGKRQIVDTTLQPI